MLRARFRPGFPCVGFLILAVLVTGAAHAGSKSENTWSVDVPLEEGQAVQVENLLGSIRVKGGKRTDAFRVEARVQVEARSEEDVRTLVEAIRPSQWSNAGAAGLRVDVPVDRYPELRLASSKGNAVSRWIGSMFRKGAVQTEYDGRPVTIGKSRKVPAVAVHLEVTVPFGRELIVDQNVGTLEVRHLRGTMTLRSVEGRVEAFDLFETLRVEGGSATVAIDSFQGDDLIVSTTEGDVELAEIRSKTLHLSSQAGLVEGSEIEVEDAAVEAGAGAVTLTGFEPRRARVHSASADIDLALDLKSLDDLTVRSQTGDVVLRVREQLGYEVLAETASGEVKTLGVDLEVVERNEGSSRLRHGAGGPVLRVAATGGTVTVRPFGASRLDLVVGEKDGGRRSALTAR